MSRQTRTATITSAGTPATADHAMVSSGSPPSTGSGSGGSKCSSAASTAGSGAHERGSAAPSWETICTQRASTSSGPMSPRRPGSDGSPGSSSGGGVPSSSPGSAAPAEPSVAMSSGSPGSRGDGSPGRGSSSSCGRAGMQSTLESAGDAARRSRGRRGGGGGLFYWLVRLLAGPALRIGFRPWVRGADNVPAEGAAILASNHLAVIDSFLLPIVVPRKICLLYTSDAADDLLCVDLGGRRIIK